MRLKKVFINLELDGTECGIIMRVTGLLLLEPFYTIQTQTHQTFLGGVYDMEILKNIIWSSKPEKKLEKNAYPIMNLKREKFKYNF